MFLLPGIGLDERIAMKKSSPKRTSLPLENAPLKSEGAQDEAYLA